MSFTCRRLNYSYFSTGKAVKKILAIVLIPILFFTLNNLWSSYQPTQKYKLDIQNGFLVNTNSCRIPDVDPFHPSIRQYIKIGSDGKVVGKKLSCDDHVSLTFQEGQYLRLKFDVIRDKYGEQFSHCVYKVINRKSDTDSQIVYSDPVKFITDVKITDEFLRVECFLSKKDDPVYINFHAFLLPKTKKGTESYSAFKNVREKLNVIMVGIDSVSRLNFVRCMPKVRNYLLQSLSAIELQGYNKVADNTFVNIVPLTTGKFLEELPWNETLNNKPMDKYNYIWKDFSRNGHATLYAEDAPVMATFNYLKAGFQKPPALYYYRPFALAMESEHSVWSHNHNCVMDRTEPSIVLDYVKDFIRTYRHQKYFSYALISRLTHEDVADTLMAEDPYLSWLQSSHEEGLFNNSVLILFSDHGMRFGSFRNTYIGRLEERLPMMYLVFPKWFHRKYPQIYQNLKHNSNRLTTHFDVYATLKHILHFDGQIDNNIKPNQRGISLFNKIPDDRTCEDAGILPHWCVCMAQTQLSISDPLAVKSAEYLLKVINRLLEYLRKCETLNLLNIKSASLMKSNDKVLRFVESKNDVINRKVSYADAAKAISIIQISVTTSPGMAEFEATVKYEEKSGIFTMAGDISRLNFYGHDADCVSDAKMRKYCYCKK